jgi:hypothetical protein
VSVPLLSVVIPTKNRTAYAVGCLKTLARLPSADLEIVVQDNSADDALGRALSVEGADARVRYEHVAAPLSVVENCDRGVAQAHGEYLTLLGDDDGVTPALLDAARSAARSGLDALTPGCLAWYMWPDVRFKHYGDRYAGRLTVRPFTGRFVERDARAGVRRSAHNAFQDLVDSVELPKLYYGLVRSACLEALRAEAGTCFPGVSPDMAVAVGVSKYVERFASLDYPLFVPGSSAKSNAGAQAAKRHVGRLEDQPHLPRDCVRTWPVEVPAVFAVQTVWAQSALGALRATGRSEEVAHFDMGLLHAMCGVLNQGYWGATLSSYGRALRATRTGRVRGAAALGVGVARTWALRARWLAGRLLRRPWYVGAWQEGGLPDIDAAVGALEARLGAGARPPWSA